MGIFSYLLPKKNSSASVAKERLQIIVARERSTRGGPDYLPQLQEELLAPCPNTRSRAGKPEGAPDEAATVQKTAAAPLN
mgnify:CR=1 FL=1